LLYFREKTTKIQLIQHIEEKRYKKESTNSVKWVALTLLISLGTLGLYTWYNFTFEFHKIISSNLKQYVPKYIFETSELI